MAKIMRVAKHIPNSMTLFNIAVGVAAIMFSMTHEYQQAAGLILVSVIVDSFDGYVARMLKSTSRFGGHLDTVSDFLAFAMAASILMMNKYGVHPLVAVLFILASVARLIYFMKTKNTTHFFGVPTTVAGGFLATIAIIDPSELPADILNLGVTALMVLLSVLMLLRGTKYYRVEIKKRRTLTLMTAGFMSLFAVNPRLFMYAILLMFIGYIAFGWLPVFRKKDVDSYIPD